MLNPKLLISREGGFRFSLILGSTWLALLAISGGATVFGGVEFHVSGEVETQTLGVGLGVQREEFEVFVRDDNWLIKIHQKAQAPTYSNAMLLDYYAFNVGNNIYTIAHAQDESGVLSRLLANPETPESWKQHPEEIPISMAWIERASVPHADARFSLPMIFYAFCSQHYLDSLKENRLEPPYFVDGRLYSYDEGATNVAAHIQRSQTAPFFT